MEKHLNQYMKYVFTKECYYSESNHDRIKVRDKRTNLLNIDIYLFKQ